MKKSEQIEFQDQIDNFNFYQQERNLNKELVEEVEIKISTQKSISSVTKNILEKKNKAEQGTLI